jgi:chloride channel protein, CIC family
VSSGDQAAGPVRAAPADPLAALRSRGYLVLLVLAALLGVPLSAGAWGFLQAITRLQNAFYTGLPRGLGFHGTPIWWPLPLLAVSGALTALAVVYLPGTGGHEPSQGLHTGGVAAPAFLPSILVAALASIGLGAVVGPEAPLIALGGGVAALAVRRLRGADERAVKLVGAAGSFAAVSALFGSPLPGAFLLMEATGLGGATLDVVLVPGLLASGVGALVFIGLDSWTGLPSTALTIPDLPTVTQPDVAQFGWALAVGAAGAVLGVLISRAAHALQRRVARRRLVLTTAAGLLVAGLAVAYAEISGKQTADVLFSGQSGMGPLIDQRAQYTVGALILLLVCKGAAYALSLSAFRGGPVFPALYLGAAGGLLLSHLPGLPFVAGIAMGIGAMSVAMLRLPLTAVLLATLLLGKDGLTVMPLVIVAVVTAHVIAARLTAPPEPAPAPDAGRHLG